MFLYFSIENYRYDLAYIKSLCLIYLIKCYKIFLIIFDDYTLYWTGKYWYYDVENGHWHVIYYINFTNVTSISKTN